MKTIYIAGPMRGREYYNFPLFDAVAKVYREAGFKVLNPADMDRQLDGFDPTELPADHDWYSIPQSSKLDEIIRRDIDAVIKADMIVMLPEWQQSPGATAERAVALWAQKRIIEWGVEW